jgi:hypothetical protein
MSVKRFVNVVSIWKDPWLWDIVALSGERQVKPIDASYWLALGGMRANRKYLNSRARYWTLPQTTLISHPVFRIHTLPFAPRCPTWSLFRFPDQNPVRISCLMSVKWPAYFISLYLIMVNYSLESIFFYEINLNKLSTQKYLACVFHALNIT